MSNSQKILIGAIGVLVLIGVVFGFTKWSPDTQNEPSVSSEAVSTFQEELSERALARGPHPVEGFDASMLLDTFPGLQEGDFDGVATGAGPEEGMHTYADGTLQWERTSDQQITSAERAISQDGYITLLNNLSQRLDMPASNAEEAVAIVDEIDIPSDVAEHIVSKHDLIRVYTPKPLSVITSPLTVRGEARGNWYFEATFSVRIEDADGNVLGRHHATAQDEWMTQAFVPFEGELPFSTSSTDTGTLILEKANPSGLPENADALEIPVLFE